MEKLSILGIRSFGPDEPQVITFSALIGFAIATLRLVDRLWNDCLILSGNNNVYGAMVTMQSLMLPRRCHRYFWNFVRPPADGHRGLQWMRQDYHH